MLKGADVCIKLFYILYFIFIYFFGLHNLCNSESGLLRTGYGLDEQGMIPEHNPSSEGNIRIDNQKTSLEQTSFNILKHNLLKHTFHYAKFEILTALKMETVQ